jgi:hypothetical protein
LKESCGAWGDRGNGGNKEGRKIELVRRKRRNKKKSPSI